jgi:hypothetical protein
MISKKKKQIVKRIPYDESNKRVRITEEGIDCDFEKTTENINKAFQRISGVSDRLASNAIITTAANSMVQTSNGVPKEHDPLNLAIALLEDIAPQDALEGMLASQMVATHNMAAAMTKLATSPNQSVAFVQQCMDKAAKLMNVYTNQLNALQKYRNKGKQTIQVQHVNVEAGGQAIVGNVSGGKGNG